MDKGLHSLSFQIALSWCFLLHLLSIVPTPNVKYLGVPGKGCQCSVRWWIGSPLLLLQFCIFLNLPLDLGSKISLFPQLKSKIHSGKGAAWCCCTSSLRISPPPLPGSGKARVQWFTSSPPAWWQGVTPASFLGPCAYSHHYWASQSSAECPFGLSVTK